MLLCLSLCLASCASKPVRTQTVEVKVPVYVALPTELLRPCTVGIPNIWTNGSLIEYTLHIKSCLDETNDKLIRIRGLQPRTSP